VSRASDLAGQRAKLARDEHRLLRRLIGAVIATAAIASLLLAVPSLRHVASAIKRMSPGWIALAIGLELASDASFVVIFRLFFDGVPAPVGRELAWTEEASGALLPGGGVGAYAVGGWLLHRAGISTRRILKRSSGLFFLTSATDAHGHGRRRGAAGRGRRAQSRRLPARGGPGHRRRHRDRGGARPAVARSPQAGCET
jgi:hypothetical protein